MDESFIEWIQDGKSVQSKWHNYLEVNPGLKEKADSAEKVILAMILQDESVERIEGIKTRIQDQIEKIEANKGLGIYFEDSVGHTKVKTRDKIWFFSRIAATITIVISLSVLLYYTPDNVFSNESHGEYESKSTLNGQKLTVHLSDGTKVRLNANSTIRYKKYFDENSRVIELDGEAFFDVAKDPNRPFMVYSGDYLTTAIGTEFNVKRNGGNAEVALLSGLVSVEGLKETGEKNYLTPGKMVVYSEESTSVMTFDYDEVIGWKDDILLLHDLTLEEALSPINEFYGADFIVSDSVVANKRISAAFENQDLDQFIQTLEFIADVKISKTGPKKFSITPSDEK